MLRFIGNLLKAKISPLFYTLLLLGMASHTASAAVMTFSGLSGTQTLPSYTENGITAVSTNGGTFWDYPSGAQLHLDTSGFGNSDFDFTYGGLAFDLMSVDVSFAAEGARGVWTAYDATDALIATYVMSADTSHTDTGFGAFVGAYRVHLQDIDAHFSIDNLTISATSVADVPEPFSGALLGIGMLALAAGRRHQRRHSMQ